MVYIILCFLFSLAVKPVLMAVTKYEMRVEQQQKMLEVLSIVKNIKNQFGKTSAVATVPDTSVLDEFLPLSTYKDMTAFEVKLTTDSDFKLTLVSDIIIILYPQRKIPLSIMVKVLCVHIFLIH